MADNRISALRRFALSITVFNLLGLTLLGFEQAYLTQISAIVLAYVLEVALETGDALAHRRQPVVATLRGREHPVRDLIDFLLPAHITGLACAMLLYGNTRLAPTLCAVTLAIAGKYVIRFPIGGRVRHVMNPSNLGIVLVLLFFPEVGIAPPYEFSEQVSGIVDWIVPVVVLIGGTMLNGKLTGKMPLIAAWVGGFVLQAVLRWALTDQISLASALLPISGIAFVLYSNYMITDPSTSPVGRRGQVAFGLGTALAYGVLVQFHVVFGLFFALAIVCAVRGAFLAVRSARRGVAPAVPPSEALVPEPTSVPGGAT